MAYLSLTTLVQRCIVRLRQVSGVTTQAYAEQNIELLIEECYEQCRALRWWDHMTNWYTRTLDGASGQVTEGLFGAREGMRDIQAIFAGSNSVPLPIVDTHHNPLRYSGTTPRAIEALSPAADPFGNKLFRVWPAASVGDLAIRMRADPANLFSDPNVLVPFDATALVNGACFKYAVMDGTNPGGVAEFDRAYNERVMQLQKQHDSTALPLDTRSGVLTEWTEEPF